MIRERLILTIINMFLPPLSVMLVAGVGMDALVNTLWLLCGVIPAHIHGFYITWTYSSRRRKVRKGRYPGGPKSFIYSTKVINGGASSERVRQLWMEEQRTKNDQLMRKRSSRGNAAPLANGGGSRMSTLGSELGSHRSAPAALGRQRSRRESSTATGFQISDH